MGKGSKGDTAWSKRQRKQDGGHSGQYGHRMAVLTLKIYDLDSIFKDTLVG
jgi:hypothetical protein